MCKPIRSLVLAFLASGFVASAGAACRPDEFESAHYIVCSFDPDVSDVRMFWRGPDAKPYATFGGLAESLKSEGSTLQFAMNGGMYGDDLSPIGLYVENDVELHKANTGTVATKPEPNFYKKPNGVFYLVAAGAGVATTDDFLRTRPKARYATQSGPMLVIDGAIHPAFIPGSTDRKRRDGVGVTRAGEVHFAITEGRVNFDAFARFFRDRLGCPNALFLDGGSAPGLYAPELGRDDAPGHGGYGPIIAAVGK